jgi:glycosyltransferase involved in cell wall biosynthesis
VGSITRAALYDGVLLKRAKIMVREDRLSVVICTKDRAQDTLLCIRSLLTQTRRPDEVVIIDSSDSDGLKGSLDLLGHTNGITFKYIHVQANLTRARNIGVDSCTGDIVMFLDDDVVLCGDSYVHEIMRIFNGDLDLDLRREIGGVSGKIMSPDTDERSATLIRMIGRVYFEAIAMVFFLFHYGDGKFQLSGLPTFVNRNVTRTTLVECLSGANMSFRRAVISKIRFDEITSYGDDDDIGYRVSRNYQNIYAPQAKVIHKVASDGGVGNRTTRVKHEVEAYRYNFEKNLPQTALHKFAFYWALLGWFISQLTRAVIERDNRALKGFISGVANMKRQSSEWLQLNQNTRGA